VAIVGSSMGGITALAAVVVLGDGSLSSADADRSAPAGTIDAPRPRIVGVVAESVPPDLLEGVANRIRRPFGRRIRRAITARLFARAAPLLGGDPRATEPIRVIALVEPVPLLLIHGSADTTVPLKAGRRLAAAAGPGTEHWVVDGADHAAAHATAPAAWDERVGGFLRRAFQAARPAAGFEPVPVPIIGTPIEPADAPAGAGVALGGGTEGD
jgi:pimeloyl-ACP methyl ester carboxylesterase